MKKAVIGTILFEEASAKYLGHFLLSIQEAVDAAAGYDWEIYLGDNSSSSDNPNARIVSSFDWGAIKYEYNGNNLGFGRGYNRLIARAVESGADYFIALNPDLIVEPDCLGKLLSALEADGKVASVSPKIRRWDFENLAKTEQIDSCGIVLRPGLIFVDLGQGEEDRGQFDQAVILGPSGAAAAFRLSALENIRVGQDYFDSNIFMYKEDCDLDYRLFLAGYRSKLVPSAIAYHDRSAKAGKRKGKSAAVRHWSWQSQKIIWRKYWAKQGLANKGIIIFQYLARWTWLRLFERDALAYRD